MITLRKLASLPAGTRQRKVLSLIRGFEQEIAAGKSINDIYLKGLLVQAADDSEWNSSVRDSASGIVQVLSPDTTLVSSRLAIRRELNGLGHLMASALGRDWADWDAASPGDNFPSDWQPIHPVRVYLDGLRSPFNVGSIMRTSMAFGAERVWVSPDCSSPDHRRSIRSSMGAVDVLPWEINRLEDLKQRDTGCIFALELGGSNMVDFEFPESGTVILGSEELGIRPELLELAEKDGGVVSISLPGAKASLNVGVAFGILMEQWVRNLLK